MGLFFSKLFVKENTAVVDDIDDEEEEYTISVKYRYIYGDIPTITSTVDAPARVSSKSGSTTTTT